MKTISTIAVLLLFFVNAFTQNEAQKWCFGNQAGLDFSTELPTTFTNSSTYPSPLCGTSISDGTGNLQFYTNGSTVWNKQHNVMDNGTGLFGGNGSSQSGLTVKQPGNNARYYIFTTGNAFHYSIVDMNLSAGMGSVTVKNTTLIPVGLGTVRESATRHCNGKDVWVVTHEKQNNHHNAFLLNSTGVISSPVVSSVGLPLDSTLFTNYGFCKLSPQGTKLMSSVTTGTNSSVFELFDFDKSTGVVSNPIQLGMFYSVLGCEFSADGSKVYGVVSNNSVPMQLQQHIIQWDLCAGSPSAIIASYDTVGTLTAGSNVYISALQLAPNGKIYAARVGSQTLGVINNPNLGGISCNYVDLGQALTSGTCNAGLPNYETNLLKAPFSFTTQTNCSLVSFSVPSYPACAGLGYTITSYEWLFGEPSSGASNSSTLTNPSHQYADGGTYNAKLIINYSTCAPDTITKQIFVPSINIAGKQSICLMESTTLTLTGVNSYTWNNGVVSSTIALSPSVTTVYSVTGTYTASSCETVKLVTVTVLPCTSIAQDELENNGVKIYPNPSNGLYHIESQNQKEFAIKVVNQLGVLVYEALSKGEFMELDLRDFSSGIYFVETKSENITHRTKIVKMN